MSFRIDSALLRAKKCAKSGAFDEAEAIYRSILSKFPKNNKAIQAYRKFKLGDTAKALSRSEPTQESINELIKLYIPSSLQNPKVLVRDNAKVI